MRKIAVAVLLAIVLGLIALFHRPFPSDRTPEGAYMRIARSVTDDKLAGMLPYLETEAQWACFSIRDMRREARDRVAKSYPEPERSTLIAAYAPLADAPDGGDVFAMIAVQRGWRARLRRDLSGAASTEIEGERATVVTSRGTRYTFRKRGDSGIWGMTMFTADLLAESERAARDLAMVKAAADDYDREQKKPAPNPTP